MKKNNRSRDRKALFVRNFIFGVEDSLVSTVGLLSGIASAGVNKNTIFITGTVLIFVEAFSMATGSFLSEHSAEEFESHHSVKPKKSIEASIIMFFSYFLTGFIPLFPYIAFEKQTAFYTSIVFSLISLFILGWVSGILFNAKVWRRAMEMLILGGVAIGVGIIVGNLTNQLQ